jgi:hypothetical protein
MGQTVHEIEGQIDRARERLGSNLDELEQRVDAATDWQTHFRAKPFVFLTAAVIGGAAAGAVLRNTRPGSKANRLVAAPDSSDGAVGLNSTGSQVLNIWNNVKAAAIGLASSRLKEYVDQLLPGFDEHYQRAERFGSFRS